MFWEAVVKFFASITLFGYAVIAVNVLLILFARPILARFSSGTMPQNNLSVRIALLRGLNLVILLVYGYVYLYRPNDGDAGGVKLIGIKILSILAILYLTNMANYIIQFIISKQYGKSREIRDKTIYIETYQTRLLSIIAAVFITIIGIVSIVNVLGFDSLLEAGGVIGIIGVFLGLTQSSWAPDIISGLIILNSGMFEEGDIIETGDGVIGRVYKTKMFHTEILNVSNNHRIMIRNLHLRDKTIHNLSKFASAKGLRECLTFKIGYECSEKSIKEMFEAAYKKSQEAGVAIEENSHIEIKVLDTGDHAVTWGVLYHIKHVDSILNIRREFRELILRTSKEHKISLATPFTHSAVGASETPAIATPET